MSVEKFGKYLLLEKLAVGGMAEIFLAKTSGSRGVEKFVVIKRILPKYSSDPNFIEMFVEEAKLNVNLSHSNIAQIFDFGIDGSQLYIAMEHVAGKNLRQLIKQSPDSKLSIEHSLYVIIEAAKGLDCAHRSTEKSSGELLNIVHRDISPQNIMVSFEGEVKVIDFGIAKSGSDELPEVTRIQEPQDDEATKSTFHELEATKTGELKGKFTYMAPEQAIGAKVDLRTDVFCLGIVLWELLSGKRLYKCISEIKTLEKAQAAEIPELPENIPQRLKEITSKALTKSIDERYQSMGEFLKDLTIFFHQTYPAFLEQNFAEEIKSLFQNDIEATSSKLVDFSKIKVLDTDKNKEETSEDRTQVSTLSAPIPINSQVRSSERPRKRRVIRRKRKRVK